MPIIPIVAFGTCLGGSLRFFLSGVSVGLVEQPGLVVSLIVSFVGALLIGSLGLCGMATSSSTALRRRQPFLAGICGGFAMLSSYTPQTVALAEAGRWLAAGGDVGLSTLSCLLGVACGYGGVGLALRHRW